MAKLLQRFNVLIIYDTVSAGKSAAATYQRLEQNLHGEYEMVMHLLRCDVLDLEGVDRTVHGRAAEVDMVIVALDDRKQGLEKVCRWLERWPSQASSPRRALVSLVTEPRAQLDQMVESAAAIQLRTLAQRLGMDLIVSEAPMPHPAVQPQPAARPAVPVYAPAPVALPPAREVAARRSSSSVSLRWGINE
jgi:hypothetical protein